LGCTLKAKFMFCTFVPNAFLWTALSYSTIESGGLLMIF
jgi:hypothetical protein